MKKVVCFFIVIIMLFMSNKTSANYDQYINKSYIVMDANTNKVVEGKEIHLVRNVASISKIMTAIVAIEYGDLYTEVTITKEDLDTYGSSVYLKEGNSITLIELIYGLMLRSGNDASLAIARAVSGSVSEFVSLMNLKASELGMNNSLFNNPNGLDANEEGNLSTSYDMALLMSYALSNQVFREIIGTKIYKSEIGVWKNKNKLLTSYKYNIGGKTGFTDKAKRTLVTASRKDDLMFVVVTLDCGNDFNFHKFLYEKNFEKYQSIKVLDEGENHIENYIVTCNNDIRVMIEKNDISEYKLVHKIERDSSKVYLINDESSELIGECKIKNNDRKESKFKRWINKYF
jgi:D-alanyl-D-alanine carboxypeptidase